MWNFITFHLRRLRENQGTSAAASGGAAPARSKKTMQEKAKERKEKKPKKGAASDDADENDLPEVDQNTTKTLRQRKPARSPGSRACASGGK